MVVLQGWSWSIGQLKLSRTQPIPSALYQLCQGENAIHAWLGLVLLSNVLILRHLPLFISPLQVAGITERNVALQDVTTIHVFAKDYHEGGRLWSNPTHTHT